MEFSLYNDAHILSDYQPPHIKWLDNNNKTGCNHNWNYVGHGHNYSSYRCTKCGVEDEYQK